MVQPDTADALPRLIASHPRLFRGSAPTVRSWLPAGWHELADRLCGDLERSAGEGVSLLRIDQVKEKFGALRVVVSFDDGFEPRLARRLREATEAVEEPSKKVCDICGSSGALMSGQGRLRTLCEPHAAAGGMDVRHRP